MTDRSVVLGLDVTDLSEVLESSGVSDDRYRATRRR